MPLPDVPRPDAPSLPDTSAPGAMPSAWTCAAAGVLLGGLVAGVGGCADAPVGPGGPFPEGEAAAPQPGVRYGFLPITGQSLSVGQARPIVSPPSPFGDLTWRGGVRPQFDASGYDPAEWYEGFARLAERLPPPGSLGDRNTLGETPCSGAAHMWHEALGDTPGAPPRPGTTAVLASAPGWGASFLSDLDIGSSSFTRLVTQASRAHALFGAHGNPFDVLAVGLVQGESDYTRGTSEAEYRSTLVRFAADLDAQLRHVTGQTRAVPTIVAQTSSHYGARTPEAVVAQAQLQASLDEPRVVLATPAYFLDFTDVFHLTGESSRILGAYLGLAAVRRLVQGERAPALQPVSHARSGRTALLRFNVPPGATLVFDRDRIVPVQDEGFDLVTRQGSPLLLEAVEIVAPDTVRLTAMADLPADAVARYAWGRGTTLGAVQGRLSGARGTLRDDQGARLVFDPAGTAFPMHRWCVLFSRTLA